jgi:two-component sensor histidine kinase
LLKDELQHRIQNLFAVIQAVIRFSLLSNDARVSAAVIKDRLLDRLQAMVDTSRHVSNANGEVALIDLIHGQMRGFDERYTVHGRPQVTLSPQLTQNFS